MAEPLKYMYNLFFFERLCPVLHAVVPGFQEHKFIHAVFDSAWPELELKERTRQITRALRLVLPDDFTKASDVIVRISEKLRQTEREQNYPFIFLPDYISEYGIDDFETSMKAFEIVTQLVSAEFAIRSFLIRYPIETMQQMYRWSKHKNENVRRLASEGCRPRLPWGMWIPALKKDPEVIWPVLENLKEDQSEYVRRSVANNLNDIAKDHPKVLLQKIKRWNANHEGTQWIIKHGCRTLLKNGSEEALTMHGFDPALKSEITKLKTTPKVHIGDDLHFEFLFRNKSRKQERFRIEYCIHYITSTGKISRKVFRIGEYEMRSGHEVAFKKRQSFQNLTTRTHFKGKHELQIVVNGKLKRAIHFQVV